MITENKQMQEKRYTIWKWRIIIATMVCYLFYYSGRFNMSICTSLLAAEFGYDNAKLGDLMSILILTYGIGQLINGNLGDRFGRILMPIGAVVSCLCNWAFSYSPEITSGVRTALGLTSSAALIFTTMTILWGINGYFQAMGMAPGGRLIFNWWTRNERGRAMGLYLFAAAMSNVTIFLMASWLAYEYGWRYAFRYPPLLMAIVAVGFYFVTKDHPEQVGLQSKESSPSHKHSGSLKQYAGVLTNSSFMLACISLGLHHVSRWGLLSFLPRFFSDIAGWNVKQAGMMSTALPVGMALGALSGGFISDKVFRGNRSRLIFFSVLLCAACTVLIPYATTGGQDVGEIQFSGSDKARIVVMLLLAGFFLYISIGPYFALCPDLLGVKNAGTGIGVMDAIAYGFAAAGTAAIGRISNAYGYDAAFSFMAACAILSAVSILFISEKKKGEGTDVS